MLSMELVNQLPVGSKPSSSCFSEQAAAACNLFRMEWPILWIVKQLVGCMIAHKQAGLASAAAPSLQVTLWQTGQFIRLNRWQTPINFLSLILLSCCAVLRTNVEFICGAVVLILLGVRIPRPYLSSAPRILMTFYCERRLGFFFFCIRWQCRKNCNK